MDPLRRRWKSATSPVKSSCRRWMEVREPEGSGAGVAGPGSAGRTAWINPAEAVSCSLEPITLPAASVRAAWLGTAPSDRSEAGVVARAVGRGRSIAGAWVADGVPAPFPRRPSWPDGSSRKDGTTGETPCFPGVSSIPDARNPGTSIFGEAIGTPSGDGMTRARFADHSAGRSVSRAVDWSP